jgi:hypothetical protein
LLSVLRHAIMYLLARIPHAGGIKTMEAVMIRGRHGRATAGDMLELLGFKRTANLPKEALPVREIQGVPVYVKPSTSGGTRERRRCSHRVIAICTCGQHVPTGRLHQHKCEKGDR